MSARWNDSDCGSRGVRHLIHPHNVIINDIDVGHYSASHSSVKRCKFLFRSTKSKSMVQNIPKTKVVAVGKVKKAWIQEGIQVYLGRSPELDILEIKDSGPDQEAEKILSLLKGNETLIALSEDGKSFTSAQFATLLTQYESHELVFVIGGPQGLGQSLRRQASLVLSLSAMTFPHELARLLLVEQFYRAKTILQGGQYHK
jgi:23S rRNA (pseudouridine1915-N3)-methyltransferase